MVTHRLARTWQVRKVMHRQDFGQQAELYRQGLVRMQQVHPYQELEQQATLYRRHVVKHQGLERQAELYQQRPGRKVKHQGLEQLEVLYQQHLGRKVKQRQGLGRMAVIWQVRKEIALRRHFERQAILYQQRQEIEQLVIVCQVPQRQAESCRLWWVIMQPVQRIARKEQHLDCLDFER